VDAVHWFHILLGALLSGCAYVFLRDATRRPRFAFWAALGLLLDPSLYLYEAFVLYTLPSAFLAMACAACLARAGSDPPRRGRWLALFFVCLNALFLTRSLYHVIVLVPAFVIAGAVARERWRRALAMGFLISLSSLGWYAKNQVQFGFFGSSSWGGLSLWKIASVTDCAKAKIPRLEAEGVLDPAGLISDGYIAKGGFCLRPSEYARFGYGERPFAEVIGRDDYHDINIVAISKLHGRNALKLIAETPGCYLEAVYTAYHFFCLPSSQHEYVAANAEKIGVHERLFSRGLLGRAFFERLQGPGLVRGLFRSSLLFFLFPLALLAYASGVLRARGFSPRGWLEAIRADPAMAFAFVLVPYTIAVSCLLEIGENDRMKVLIEQLFYCFLIALVFRIVEARRRRLRAASEKG
jgi:hypothetical protein